MHDGSAWSERTGPDRRRRRRLWLAGGFAAAAVAIVVIATGVIPLLLSSPVASYRISEVVVAFTGSGGEALCPATNGSPPTCGSAVLACGPTTPCNQTVRTGQQVGVTNGITFRTMLSDTFDCNYTFSIAQVSGAGAFTVTAAQANGAALPVNVGFNGSGSACVTEADISVGFTVGDQGPSQQDLFLTVSVAQELR